MTKELFKFAGKIVDCYDDPAFIDAAGTRSLFNKGLVSPEKLQELPDSAFAIKIAGRAGQQRRFPIYNEEITKVSCYYFEKNYEELPQEVRDSAGFALSNACDKYGIYKTASIAEHSEKEAPAVVEHVTKETGNLLADSAELMKQAEFRLACELPKMVLDNRTNAATAWYKTAGDEGTTRQDVWDYVEKPVVGPLLEGALDDRASFIKSASPECKAIFDEMRNRLDDMEPAAIVDTLKEFDKFAGIDSRYSYGFTDPYLSVYGGWDVPFVRERNRSALRKEAEIVDGQTGRAVDATTAKGLSVEQHLFNLQNRYPKGTESFKKAASAGSTPDMEQKWGQNYVKARRLHFGG